MRVHHSVRVLSTIALLAVANALTSCSEPASSGETYAFVMDELRLLSDFEVMDNGATMAAGFDIDASDGPIPNSPCRGNPTDHVGRDGSSGVDNALATLYFQELADLLAQLAGDGGGTMILDVLVQSAVQSGELAILLQFDDVDSFENDDDVTMTLSIGLPSSASTGTDGRLLAGQSFDVDPSIPPVSLRTRIRDGVVLADGFELQARGEFVGMPFDLPIKLGQLRLEFHPAGTITGELGGAINWRSIADVLPTLGTVEPEIISLANLALQGLTDIANPDTGECDSISTALRVHGVQAFIYDRPPPSGANAAAP